MKHPPIFEAFPELRDHIPWVSIIPEATPVRQLTRLQDFLQTDELIWVKLDNRTSNVYGGNKVRKLEFLLGDALHHQKHTIATMGGLGTNHGLATTIHGQAQQLRTRLYLADQPVTPQVLRNLKLMYHFGANLIYVKTEWQRTLRFYLLDRLRHRGMYWLPTGGSIPLGVLGYVNAVFELYEQIQAGLLPEPQWIFIPAGSGGTIAGIELGVQLTGLATRVKGIGVTPTLLSHPNRVTKMVQRTLSLLQRADILKDIEYKHRFQLADKFLGRGYGYPTSDGEKAMQLAAELEDLTLDPTYTSKTLAGLIEHIRTGQPGPVLYWHTLNSVDLSVIADKVDYRNLPAPFHRFFTEKTPVI